ncbi:helix-turn-helix domain-containing protein [Methylobacterium symbioticum]|uniref:Transcriptional activator NphR n=1 Tax=Methylobacterium symbioticum TaxID=2584084 RepID=A0A509E7I3_9HYPH|nr:helix-turn-helix domain-containing protein [Methylobacterium symbioticum]VUD69499.1 Transcriptional activator NphR [Methylobacterium symbioticum]
MAIQSFIFDSSEEDGTFEGYRSLYAGGSDVSATGERFRARVDAHRLGRMIVFDRRLGGVMHSRDGGRVRRDGFDHFTIQLLRSGRFHGGSLGSERLLDPGEVILFDMTCPQRTRADGAHFVTVSLARDLIEAVLPDARRLHGEILPAAAAGLLADLMESLARRAGSLSPETAGRTSRALAELLAGAFGAPDALAECAHDAAADLRRQRAETYIEAHLHDPRLDPERVADALALSRTTLYGLFAQSGGVARHILTRRLERLRSALGRPSETRSVTTLTYDHGFTSESHCSRAFRAAFGMPPGRYRSEMERLRVTGTGSALASETGAMLAAWSRALA